MPAQNNASLSQVLALPLLEPVISNDIELLHSISIELISEQNLEVLYGKIVDAAVTITGSQFGTMQLLCPQGDPSGHGGKLRLLYAHGLSPEAISFWQWVPPTAISSCTQALKRGQRAVIPDFERWDTIAGTEDLLAFRRAGIRSAQTTPLLSRNGTLLGMISTHWNAPHTSSARDLRLLDILARQAADLLERTIAEEALRKREQELAQTCQALKETEEKQRQAEAQLRLLNETLEQRVVERSAELFKAEEQLRQSQKMEAVGQLTGGLAHDFNNLLTGVLGSLEMMSRRIRQSRVDELEKYVTAAHGAATRAASLTQRLLAFSRRQVLQPDRIDVDRLVKGMMDLIKRTIGPGITLEATSPAHPWSTYADAGQLENALLNLCINARDAMPHGGLIRIEVANDLVAHDARRSHAIPDGEYLRLSVTDNGAGMPPEVLAHAFEPFFTTKPVGQGTGLGLSMIYGFTEQSGGHTRIESQENAGTTVSIYLPRFKETEHPQCPPGPAQAIAAAGESESILLVDNEPTSRSHVAEMLRQLGYTVLQVEDSPGALKMLSSGARIDLLLTDVGLPGGMNGRQLAEAGIESRPGLKTLLITGHAEQAAIRSENLHGEMRVLAKPFSAETLGTRLRDSLSSARSQQHL